MSVIVKEDRVKQPLYRSIRSCSRLETEDESRIVAGDVLLCRIGSHRRRSGKHLRTG